MESQVQSTSYILFIIMQLQKYRMFLQQVLDGKIQIQYSKWIDLNYNSSIVPGNPDLFLLNQLSEKRRKGDLAVGTNVQFPNGSSSSGQYRPLPQYTRAGELIILIKEIN